MTIADEMEGLVGEDEPEVSYEAASGCVREPQGEVLEPEVLARRVRGGRYLINGRVEVVITLHPHRPAGGLPVWVASALLETSNGPMQWSASATEQEVAVRMAAREGGVAGFDLGRELSRLFGGASNQRAANANRRPAGNANRRTTQRGAQNLAFQRVVGDIRRTLDSPAGKAVTNVLSAIPYVGPAVQGVRAATTLVDNVARGNTRSRANLNRLQSAARNGHPAARRAVGVVESVLRAQRGMAVSRARGPAPRRRRSAAEERAWRTADQRWNEYRAARARQGVATPEPIITPPPRSR